MHAGCKRHRRRYIGTQRLNGLTAQRELDGIRARFQPDRVYNDASFVGSLSLGHDGGIGIDTLARARSLSLSRGAERVALLSLRIQRFRTF